MAQLVKTVNGLAIASVKTVYGLAIASVKTIMALDNTAAGGAISVVQVLKTSTSSTAYADVSITPTAGNALIMVMGHYGNSSHTNDAASDSGSHSWTKIGGADATSAPNYHVSMWQYSNIASGITSVRGTGGNTAGATVIVFEIANANTFTGGEVATDDQTSASTTHTASAVTNATTASIFFSAFASTKASGTVTFTENASGSTGTWTATNTNTNGGTSVASAREVNATTYVGLDVVYQIVASGAARHHVWTSDTSTYGAMATACFHA